MKIMYGNLTKKQFKYQSIAAIHCLIEVIVRYFHGHQTVYKIKQFNFLAVLKSCVKI